MHSILKVGPMEPRVILHALTVAPELWSEDEIPLYEAGKASAWDKVPQVRPVIFDIMRGVEAISLLYAAFTKIGPGDAIKVDDMPEPTVRHLVVIYALPGGVVRADGEEVHVEMGDFLVVRAAKEFSIENRTGDEMIFLALNLELG